MRLKRTFDVLVGVLGLLLLLVPMLIIAILIKCNSPGPVLFCQTRVGRFGREFPICKFRTMFANADGNGLPLTVGGDPRITRVGAILRRHKLDELPQLWNVLVGDMSIVGPRPEVPCYVARYPAAVRDVVLSVRPGITDLASIAFRNENDMLSGSADPEKTYLEVVLPKKLQYCVEYVRTRTLAMDAGIVFRTLFAVFSRRPDYRGQFKL